MRCPVNRAIFSASARLLFLLISALAAGGCGTSPTSSPELPTPQFLSSPPSSAVEGVAYTYQITMLDSTVTLSLATAPEGARLDGFTLSWVPTPAQARVPHDFSLIATASSGRRGIQSWRVVPNGTIRGSYIDAFWSLGGLSQKGHDLSPNQCSWCAFAAIVRQADGSWQTLPGSGSADGTFEIHGVPAGQYWLQISSQPPQLFWTSSSTFDMGRDYAGRYSEPVPTEFAFSLNGLSPWQSSDYISLVSPNAGASVHSRLAPVSDSTSLQGTETVTALPIDPEKGDITFVLQYQPLSAPLSGYAVGPSLYLPDLKVYEGGTTSVAGSLTLAPRVLELTIQKQDWMSLFASAGPGTPSPYLFLSDVSVQPFPADKSLVPRVALLRIDPQMTDISLGWNYGILQYSDPFPSDWPRVFSITESAIIQVPLPDGGTMSFPVSAGYQSNSIPSTAVGPMMTPIRNPVVNGASLLDKNTLDSTSSIRLAWSAPTGLSAFGYVIQLYKLSTPPQGTPFYEGPIATLCTDETSLIVPKGLLPAGNAYVFRIQARADARANMQSTPWRSGYPIAFADFVSGPIVIK